MTIKILVNGAQGKMGKVTVAAIQAQNDLTLVGTTGSKDHLAQAIARFQPDVVVDFTRPDCVFANTEIILKAGARAVIGTTGLSLEQIKTLDQQCSEKKLGCIIAPNFSLGAILMMKYAQDAAKYLPDVEIIEMHHTQKLDAPSGTAKKTAELIAQNKTNNHNDSAKARGEQYQGVNIHSIRLPGFFAHQAVIFGGNGETLTIRHDAVDRNAMMPGVILAIRKVMETKQLIYGLENIL